MNSGAIFTSSFFFWIHFLSLSLICFITNALNSSCFIVLTVLSLWLYAYWRFKPMFFQEISLCSWRLAYRNQYRICFLQSRLYFPIWVHSHEEHARLSVYCFAHTMTIVLLTFLPSWFHSRFLKCNHDLQLPKEVGIHLLRAITSFRFPFWSWLLL